LAAKENRSGPSVGGCRAHATGAGWNAGIIARRRTNAGVEPRVLSLVVVVDRAAGNGYGSKGQYESPPSPVLLSLSHDVFHSAPGST
jgi:hypothetical protein